MKKINFSLLILLALVSCSTEQIRIDSKQLSAERSLASDKACPDLIEEFFIPPKIAQESFDWPENFQVAELGYIQVFITNNLKKEMTWKQRETVELGSIEWTGQKQLIYIPNQIDVNERFSQASLLYHKKKFRDVSSVLLWTYLNLGMDQGVRRIKNSSTIKQIKKMGESFKLASAQEADQIQQEKMLVLVTELKGIVQDIKSNPLKIMDAYNNKEKKEVIDNIIHPTVEMFQNYNDFTGANTAEETKKLYHFLTSNLNLAEEQGARVWYDEVKKNISNLENIITFSEKNLANGKFSPIEAYMISGALELLLL